MKNNMNEYANIFQLLPSQARIDLILLIPFCTRCAWDQCFIDGCFIEFNLCTFTIQK